MTVIQLPLELRRGSLARHRVGMCLLLAKAHVGSVHCKKKSKVRTWGMPTYRGHRWKEKLQRERETKHLEMREKVSRKREVNRVK